MLGHQLLVRRLVSDRAAIDERRLATTNIRPTDDARVLQGDTPGGRHLLANSFHYKQFRRLMRRKVP